MNLSICIALNLQPEIYVSSLLMCPDDDAMISTLQKRNLCINMQSDYVIRAGMGFFSIICNLTDNGLKYIDDIIELIFQVLHKIQSTYFNIDWHVGPLAVFYIIIFFLQYIFLLINEGVEEWIFNEIKNLSYIAFLEQQDETMLEYTEFLATSIQVKY